MYNIRIFISIIIIIISTLLGITVFPMYKVISHDLCSFKKTSGRLIVCTHNYEHVDIFIMLRELSYIKEQVYVVFADEIWNKLIEFFKVVNTTFIFTTNKTTEKIINQINNGNTVLLFLYNLKFPRTGIYHVLNSTGCDLILSQIKSKHEETTHLNSTKQEIFTKNFNKTYTVKYNKINYILGICPKKFMDKFKKYL
jgi:hypothetical protein